MSVKKIIPQILEYVKPAGYSSLTNKKRKRIIPKARVQVIISREYVGTQTVAEAFIPIISEDIRRKIAEGDTFDNEGISA